jgi:RNA-directed DNA polymerase
LNHVSIRLGGIASPILSGQSKTFMIEQVLKPKNLYKAYRQVVRNKGVAGIDHMKVGELLSYLDNNRNPIINMVANCAYVSDPILGVEIPKSNGKTRLLGTPEVVG